MTGLRVPKESITCHLVLHNPHDKQITALEFAEIPKLLHHIPLRMNRIFCVATATGPRSDPIACHLQNLSTPHKHCYMKARSLHLPQLHCVGVLQKGLQQSVITLPYRLRHLCETITMGATFQFYSSILKRMDLYEVHVPCGQKVVVICKENGEAVKILKNGKPVYKENEAGKKNNNGNAGAPGALGNAGASGSTGSNGNEGAPGVNPAPAAAAIEDVPDQEESDATVGNNMAGGKKSRRNNARKNNATRRKGQAGGKRGPNGYMKFANKIRPQILKEHPELKSDVVGVARKIGEKWRSMSDAEKKKY